MTNKDYLMVYLEGLGITEGEIDIIMLDEGIVPSATAEPRKCKLAIYNRMSIILKAATGNKTEGGYSVKWNMAAVKMFYNALCMEMGFENRLYGSSIEDATECW